VSVQACPSCFPALTPGGEVITIHIDMPALSRAVSINGNTFKEINTDTPVLIVVMHAATCLTAAAYRRELVAKMTTRSKKPKTK
jgi:hypothetical protein